MPGTPETLPPSTGTNPAPPESPPRPPTRGWLRLLGAVVAAACIVAVLVGYHDDLSQAADQISWPTLSAAVGIGAVVYAGLGLLLSTAWWLLIGAATHRPAWIVGLVIWGSAQWAKYLPSNTLHFVGRQVLGGRYGLGQATLAVSSTLETLSLIAAAVVVAGCGRILEGTLTPAAAFLAIGLIAAGLVVFAGLEGGLRRLPWTARLMSKVPRIHERGTYRRLAASMVLHVGFFLAVGGIGWLLALVLFPSEASTDGSLFRLVWVFASAWLAGTLTVGAPAGVGVREGVLVLGLSASLGGPAAVTLAIVLRAVTVLGDGLVAGAALLASSHAPGGPVNRPE